MKKTLTILLIPIVLIIAFIILVQSCVVSNEKYDYDDLSEYIKLPNYKTYTYTLEEDAIKQAIGTYLMQYSSEYTIKRGDRPGVG